MGCCSVSLMGGIGLGLYMAFTMRVNAVNALIYSAFEGFLLGAISRIFEERWPGIVVQAVTGTVMVAAGMLIVYKTGRSGSRPSSPGSWSEPRSASSG